MKIIKKYENRCLYDAELSANITIQDLKQYVLDATPFKVINAKTEEDITRSCLIQIILELESLANPFFSQIALEQIIRFHGDPQQTKMQQYLEQSLTVMSQWQKLWVDTLKDKI